VADADADGSAREADGGARNADGGTRDADGGARTRLRREGVHETSPPAVRFAPAGPIGNHGVPRPPGPQ